MKCNLKMNTRLLKLYLVALLILSLTGCDRIGTRITPEQIEEIRTICSSIKVPPSFVKTGQYESDRITHATFSMEYSSSDPPEVIIDFFKQELKEPKWRLEREVNGEPHELVFKRAGYAVAVIISQTHLVAISAGTRYGAPKVFIDDLSVECDRDFVSERTTTGFTPKCITLSASGSTGSKRTRGQARLPDRRMQPDQE